MLERLIDSIFLIFGERVFQQTVGIPLGTNCDSLRLVPLFERDRHHTGSSQENEEKLARSFN
jgi:hypothetical protein